jgi:peroxiredoxin
MNGSEIAEYRTAPDFELTDSEGRQIRLSSYKGVRHVVLIFNRGFL